MWYLFVLTFGGIILGFELRALIEDLKNWSKPKDGEDGIICIENKTVVLHIDIPVEELITRENVSLKVDIPDSQDLQLP